MELFAFLILVVPAFVERFSLAFEGIRKCALMVAVESGIDIFISQSFEQSVRTAETL